MSADDGTDRLESVWLACCRMQLESVQCGEIGLAVSEMNEWRRGGAAAGETNALIMQCRHKARKAIT